MAIILKYREAILYKTINGESRNEVSCFLCAHKCRINNNDEGKCRTRINQNGRLIARNWGYPLGVALDPIEKKPFFHFKPGTKAFSLGTAGCNFTCRNCQNWHISQYYISTGRASHFNNIVPPDEILKQAIELDADGIAYTYSEPAIFFEYVLDIINSARSNNKTKHFYHTLVSNGFFSNELIDLIISLKIDAVNIDLKFSNNSKYKEVCNGRIKPVINSIEQLNDAGIHLEITNLLIPGYNDDTKSIEDLCRIVSNISCDIPLHINRFIPKYRMTEISPTNIDIMIKSRDKAKNCGIKYIYLGNIHIDGATNTFCPDCGNLIIERDRYIINKYYGLFVDKHKKAYCRFCNNELNIVL